MQESPRFSRGENVKQSICVMNCKNTKGGQATGSSIQRYAYTRTCNRINQYYMSATGQRVAKRIVDGAFPYDIPDKGGKMIYRKGKLQT